MDAVHAVTLGQHGLITRKQALTAGITRHGITHRLASGRWEQVTAGGDPTWLAPGCTGCATTISPRGPAATTSP